MSHPNIKPELIRWACERSGAKASGLKDRFPKLAQWQQGIIQPTFKQLEDFAKATLTPLGWFFLPAPPVEVLPMPDFRTVGDQSVGNPSAALLETIYAMQRRQEWLKDYLMEEDAPVLEFIGSCDLQMSSLEVAAKIRNTLGLQSGWSKGLATWEDALLALRRAAESAGIMVVSNGIVGNNTHQPLDPEEFRGFVLCDNHAPLVFINGADAKAAQMFTLAHELAHLWLGNDGLFNLDASKPSSSETERFCNAVAAEVLVPQSELTAVWAKLGQNSNRFAQLAKHFKVSPIAAARRALDAGYVTQAEFFTFWKQYKEESMSRKQNKKALPEFLGEI
jgi:Zn-dependent peptidase ImmA (M78 family)